LARDNEALILYLEQKQSHYPYASIEARFYLIPAHSGKATFARLTRPNGKYWLAILLCEFVQYHAEKNMSLMKQTDLAWPHAFTRFACSADEFIATYASNHIHAVYGDWVEELRTVADLLDIEARVYSEGR
jgi:L-fucose isomerase